MHTHLHSPLTPDILLQAYAAGIFPMAESAESEELLWYNPPVRAVIPLDDRFHVSKSLKRTIRQKPFAITFDTAFERVMEGCAAPAQGRETTWINRDIINAYCALHTRGLAHSIEAWDGDDLVGGLYGVSLGSAFFGESMFSRATNASKIVLVYSVILLRSCGFTLFDTQFLTRHLAQFGTYELTRAHYLRRLHMALQNNVALQRPKDLDHLVVASLATTSLQPISQIS